MPFDDRFDDTPLPGTPWVGSNRQAAHPAAPLGGGGWGQFGLARPLGAPGNDSALAPHPWSAAGRQFEIDWALIRRIQKTGVPVDHESPSADAAEAQEQAEKETSPLRQSAVRLCREVLPAPYLSKNYKANPFHVTKDNPQAKGAYSTCGEFPAYIVWLLQGKPNPARFRPGTTALPPQGAKRGAWRTPNGTDWPRPGDLYALCSTATLDDSVAHVGVILDPKGTTWETADWGQPDPSGGGFAGAIVQRSFDPVRGTLTGDPTIGTAPRAIKGWIDLDAYFAKGG